MAIPALRLHECTQLEFWDGQPLNQLTHGIIISNLTPEAESKGLKLGDKILSINGTPLEQLSEIQLGDLLFNNPKNELQITLLRQKQKIELTLPTTPVQSLRDIGIGYTSKTNLHCLSPRTFEESEFIQRGQNTYDVHLFGLLTPHQGKKIWLTHTDRTKREPLLFYLRPSLLTVSRGQVGTGFETSWGGQLDLGMSYEWGPLLMGAELIGVGDSGSVDSLRPGLGVSFGFSILDTAEIQGLAQFIGRDDFRFFPGIRMGLRFNPYDTIDLTIQRSLDGEETVLGAGIKVALDFTRDDSKSNPTPHHLLSYTQYHESPPDKLSKAQQAFLKVDALSQYADMTYHLVPLYEQKTPQSLPPNRLSNRDLSDTHPDSLATLYHDPNLPIEARHQVIDLLLTHSNFDEGALSLAYQEAKLSNDSLQEKKYLTWFSNKENILNEILTDPDEIIRLRGAIFLRDFLVDPNGDKTSNSKKWLLRIENALKTEPLAVIRQYLWGCLDSLDPQKDYLNSLKPEQRKAWEDLSPLDSPTNTKKFDSKARILLLKTHQPWICLKVLYHLLYQRSIFKETEHDNPLTPELTETLKTLTTTKEIHPDVRYFATLILLESQLLEDEISTLIHDPDERIRWLALSQKLATSSINNNPSITPLLNTALDKEARPYIRSKLWNYYILNDPQSAYSRMARDYFKAGPLEKDYLQALSYKRLQIDHQLLLNNPEKQSISLEELKLIREARWGKNIRVSELALFYPQARIQGQGPSLKELSQMILPYRDGTLNLAQAFIDKNGDLDITAQLRSSLKQWAPTLVIRQNDEKPIPLDYTLHNGTLILPESIKDPAYQQNRGLILNLLTDKQGLPLEKNEDVDLALTKLGFDPKNKVQIARAISTLGIQEEALWIPSPSDKETHVFKMAGLNPYNVDQMEKELEHQRAQNKTQIRFEGDIYDLPTLVRVRKQIIFDAYKKRLLVKLFDYDGVELAINPVITDRPDINNRDLKEAVTYASARISPKKLSSRAGRKNPKVVFQYRRFNTQSYPAIGGKDPQKIQEAKVQHQFDNESHYIELDLRTLTLERVLLGRHYYHELYDRQRLAETFLKEAKTDPEKQEALKRVQRFIHGDEKLPISVAFLSHGTHIAQQHTQDMPAGATAKGFPLNIMADHFPGFIETKSSTISERQSVHINTKVVTIDRDPFSMDSEIQFGMSGLNLFFGSGVKVDRDISKDGDFFLINRDKGLDYFYQQADDYKIKHQPARIYDQE